MKKLMVLAAAMMVAAATQAASVYWSATNVYLGNATDKATGIAYFMVSDTAYTTLTAGGLDVAGVTAALGSAYSYANTTAGTYSKSSPGVNNADLGLADATAYTAYLVIFDGATVADSTKYFISNTKTFETLAGTSTTGVSFMSQKTASQAATGWTDIVPEPTSGLMLLVGLAGLALKRKVA